jgi:CBS domain-containing protein
MAQTLRDVMTTNPVMIPASATIVEAARMMRDSDVGDVLVEREGDLCGIVTDRDIVLRAVADGKAPTDVQVGDVCSGPVESLSPTDSLETAAQMMSDKAIRRLPVCEGGQAVGIVSLGDVAMTRDSTSPLADISAAPPNN